MSQTSLENVIITGAAGNLGQAVARKFHAQGCRLALLDYDEKGLAAMADELGSNCETYKVDLTSLESVATVIKAVLDTMGYVDAVANIAGGFKMGPLLQDTDEKTWNFMFDLNARSVFNICHEVLPSMVSRSSGKIINISARAALNGKAKMAPYCASKSAVITLTESLAAENRMHNINVNCILPGTIDTPQNRADMPDADFSTWVPPSGLADVVSFLASDEAAYINGAAVPVFGKS